MKDEFRFSSRFFFQEGENEFAEILSDYKRQNVAYIDLTASNPTQAGFQYPSEAIRHSFQTADLISYLPDPQGDKTARDTIREYYKSKGMEIQSEDLFLVSSSSEAYSYLFKLFCDAGDSILIPAPGYPLFEFLSAMEGLNTISYYTKKENLWKLQRSDLKPKDLEKSKLLLIVSPNNPTGSIFTESDFASIKELLIYHNIPLIIDEVFSDYVYDGEVHSTLIDTETPVITVNGLSKILGMPGMKLSWILLSGPANWKRKTKEFLELISDTYLSVNTPAQNVLSDLMKWRTMIQTQILKRIQRNRTTLKRILSEFELSKKILCDLPKAGWYCTLESEFFFPEEKFALRLLKEKQVYTHAGEMFGFPELDDSGRIVLSLLTETESFEIGMGRIVEFLNESGSA
ncbi:pyridoxal phosphate-dependent aminotransferase [Leptospira stimsonii]|uniref:Pyridoxal phosphate-dependent aminotransferase n=1 Tax=Leptospira stimsonii TaxID=2202203 RepID=A0ABY2NAP7_9LEPT|nr:pyridoxal phosphate-dependent aminotransferase [Leptospira stimsonii]TGK11266.1 pyridoxal phosphate-dependent aminotransferase [Leptospira stimsonii]TGM19252.1 pyridoxal phosphate-dependent aminotransferase [Leptospira stimsonii]